MFEGYGRGRADGRRWLHLATREREAAMRGTSDRQIGGVVALTAEDLVLQE